MVAFLVPLGIQAAVRAAPFAARFAKPALKFGYEGLKKGLGYFRPYQMAPGVRASGNQVIQSGKFAGQKFKDVYPNLFRRGNMPRFNITSTNPANIALQTGATAAPFAYDFLSANAEQSVEDNKIDDSQITETKGKKAGADRKQAAEGMLSEGIKNLAGETTDTPEGEKAKDIQDVFKLTNKQSNDIKDGKLDDYIKQNMSVFDKYLGDTKGRSKAAVYNAMVQFGLGLASARGGNLADKIARSAREPLAEFAKVGTALADRADKIKMAAVEQGLKQQQQEREFAQEKELAEMDATGGTDFQQNLATIQLMAPDLNSKDQIRLARGLKLGETKEEYIRNNITNWMAVTGEDQGEAQRNLGNIYDGNVGGGGNLPTITTEEEYNALPPGSFFIQNGQQRQKPAE